MFIVLYSRPNINHSRRIWASFVFWHSAHRMFVAAKSENLQHWAIVKNRNKVSRVAYRMFAEKKQNMPPVTMRVSFGIGRRRAVWKCGEELKAPTREINHSSHTRRSPTIKHRFHLSYCLRCKFIEYWCVWRCAGCIIVARSPEATQINQISWLLASESVAAVAEKLKQRIPSRPREKSSLWSAPQAHDWFFYFKNRASGERNQNVLGAATRWRLPGKW